MDLRGRPTLAAGAFLDAAERLPVATLHSLTQGRPIVVLAPHPDDESLGCGGLIAEAAAQGHPVQVIVVSDGTGSHPNSAAYPPTRLKALREAETRDAVAALGLAPGTVNFLGLRDREVPAAGAAAEAVAVRVAAAVPQGCCLLATWLHDPHGDHAATWAIGEAAAARAGALLLAYPVWGWSLPRGQMLDQAPPRGWRLDVSARVDAKRRAIAAHRSQTTGLVDDDPDGFRLDPTMIDRMLRPFEVYLLP